MNDDPKSEVIHARLINAVLDQRTAEEIDRILNLCQDMECHECGLIVCPWHDPMHFHHDGCPTCAEHETPNEGG